MALPGINTDLLYTFVTVPETISVMFLGLVDITAKSLPLSLLTGLAQFFQGRLTIPTPAAPEKGNKPDFKSDLAHTMQLQMRYMLPIIIFIVTYTISSVLAFYFITGSLFAIVQEYVVKSNKEKRLSLIHISEPTRPY